MERVPLHKSSTLPLCLMAILMLGCTVAMERAEPVITNATNQNIDVAMSFPISRRSQERFCITVPPGGEVRQSRVVFPADDKSARPSARITSGDEQCNITFSKSKQKYEVILVNGTLVARPIPEPVNSTMLEAKR